MRFTMRAALAAAFVGVMAAPALALTEDFPDPLGGFYTRWLGANSNIGSYYYSSGSSSDLNYRGNNPDGLWISGNQTFGGGVSGPDVTIKFGNSFGHSLNSFSFGIGAYIKCDITIFDSNGATLTTDTGWVGGSASDYSHVVSAVSTTGIGGFEINTAAYGGGQVSGNTAVDDFKAGVVPEPTSMIALGAGALALLARRRRK